MFFVVYNLVVIEYVCDTPVCFNYRIRSTLVRASNNTSVALR